MTTATLRRFNRFDDVRSWTRDTQRLGVGASAKSWHDVDGVFVGEDDAWVAIVRDRDLLVSRPGEQCCISDIKAVEVVPTNQGGREVSLRLSNGAIWVAEYKTEGPYSDGIDPTPYVEPEDFDFGHYVRSLVFDPGRQDRLFRRER